MATIFMLHRVFPVIYPRLTPNEDLKISPDYLIQVIELLLKRGYTFISVDELYEILISSRRYKKLIVFTLDDGYKDNLTQALPVFESFNIPFIVYITNCFPDQTANLWWYTLEEIVQTNTSVHLSNDLQFACYTPEEKWETFTKIRELILENKIDCKELDPFSQSASIQTLCMNWEEVQQLSKHPLVTIGAHTLNHPVLKNLSLTEATYEISASRDALEGAIHKKIDHFAYPFGEFQQAGHREFSLVQELGFKTAVTTRSGHIFPQHQHHLTALPRIYLYENGFKLDELMFNNVFWSNKFKQVVTI
ncbi:polysaccharide deacetylase family protein [Xanthocytophaga agilis]|uniref:Polysaccharide deacetylase family protein n=1 Tax=Xanthocytophaga agilis TaxID=3048010 RepID=A0AAE3QYF7_9BACT|nr:polysaccharide deacetylase family protein [Xanthocytophaga agilis]MDJ1500411.1 polysaccharide deacetylase family protein [Xanthocytophaga agilis]